MGNALSVIFQRDEQHGLAGQAVGDGLVQLGETVRQLVLQHFPCAGGLGRGGQLRGDGVEVIGRGEHSVGGTGGSGGILRRGHVQHNVRRCERIFQRGGVRVRVQCAHTVRVGVGVGFVRQCGVVLGHEQLERLQRCAADGVGHGAFNAALLDAGVHNFACVVRQA